MSRKEPGRENRKLKAALRVNCFNLGCGILTVAKGSESRSRGSQFMENRYLGDREE
jgi:hypothetical protein